MGQRLIISEEERNLISSIYNLINEQESLVANPTQKIILDVKDNAVIGTYDEKRRTNQKNFSPNAEGKKRGFKESDELPQGVTVQKVGQLQKLDQTSKFNKLVETRQGDVKPFVNESEFKTNMPLRLRGTFEGDFTYSTQEKTIYLKYEPKFNPRSRQVDFVWSYENVAPRPADRIGKFICGKDFVTLPGSGDVSAFNARIYDDTALMMMKNYCKAGQKNQPNSINESNDFKENSVLIFRDTESSPIPRTVSINLKTKPSRHYVNGKDMNEVVFEWSHKANEPSWGPQKYGKFDCIKEYVHLPEVSDVAETHGKIVRDDMLMMMKNYCKGGQNNQPNSTWGTKRAPLN